MRRQARRAGGRAGGLAGWSDYSETMDSGAVTVPWRAVALTMLVGLGTGVLTQFGQSVLPDAWSPVANAMSPWLAVAFLVGATMPSRRSAAVAAVAALVLALVGYYAMTEIRYGIGAGTGSLVRWGLGAFVGGPVFGIAGFAWRHEGAPQRAIALGLLAAVFIAEGIYQARVVAHPAAGVSFIVVGLLIPVLLGRSMPDRLRTYAATIPALALGAIGFAVLLWLDGAAAGIN